MKKERETPPTSQETIVYTTKKMMEMFGVSAKTISRWRNDGLIGFCHVGDQYYYTDTDISIFLQNSHVDAFA